MKTFFTALFLLPLLLSAQNVEPVVVSRKAHKIIIQLTNGDTMVHKSTVKQIQNLLNAAPNSKIEVVCHNNGISFLQASQTKQAARIKELKARGVDFVACENTLRERKIDRAELLPESRTVPAGILEVVMKQEKAYAYIKAGN